MVNYYEDVLSNLQFKKFVIGELLFSEYTCPLEEESVGIWTHMDYLIHVVSGKKTWHTARGTWVAESGQTLFFKKGAAVVQQFFDDNFCLLVFFVPDIFVRDIVKELAAELKGALPPVDRETAAMRVNNDVAITAFLQSMLAYFSGAEKPSEPLLRLKLKELIIGILLSENNPSLSSYFQSVANSKAPEVAEIMEANFQYNLSLDRFAAMCHRSLSSFKRDFRKQYDESPGRWLLQKRLDYSTTLLGNTRKNISQVGYECGFEDLSHFSRVFKKRFGVSPANFRKQALPNTPNPVERPS
jgi:AraC-like DNA-binding protein